MSTIIVPRGHPPVFYSGYVSGFIPSKSLKFGKSLFNISRHGVSAWECLCRVLVRAVEVTLLWFLVGSWPTTPPTFFLKVDNITLSDLEHLPSSRNSQNLCWSHS